MWSRASGRDGKSSVSPSRISLQRIRSTVNAVTRLASPSKGRNSESGNFSRETVRRLSTQTSDSNFKRSSIEPEGADAVDSVPQLSRQSYERSVMSTKTFADRVRNRESSGAITPKPLEEMADHCLCGQTFDGNAMFCSGCGARRGPKHVAKDTDGDSDQASVTTNVTVRTGGEASSVSKVAPDTSGDSGSHARQEVNNVRSASAKEDKNSRGSSFRYRRSAAAGSTDTDKRSQSPEEKEEKNSRSSSFRRRRSAAASSTDADKRSQSPEEKEEKTLRSSRALRVRRSAAASPAASSTATAASPAASSSAGVDRKSRSDEEKSSRSSSAPRSRTGEKSIEKSTRKSTTPEKVLPGAEADSRKSISAHRLSTPTRPSVVAPGSVDVGGEEEKSELDRLRKENKKLTKKASAAQDMMDKVDNLMNHFEAEQDKLKEELQTVEEHAQIADASAEEMQEHCWELEDQVAWAESSVAETLQLFRENWSRSASGGAEPADDPVRDEAGRGAADFDSLREQLERLQAELSEPPKVILPENLARDDACRKGADGDIHESEFAEAVMLKRAHAWDKISLMLSAVRSKKAWCAAAECANSRFRDVRDMCICFEEEVHAAKTEAISEKIGLRWARLYAHLEPPVDKLFHVCRDATSLVADRLRALHAESSSDDSSSDSNSSSSQGSEKKAEEKAEEKAKIARRRSRLSVRREEEQAQLHDAQEAREALERSMEEQASLKARLEELENECASLNASEEQLSETRAYESSLETRLREAEEASKDVAEARPPQPCPVQRIREPKALRLRVAIIGARGLWSADPRTVTDPCCSCEVLGKPLSQFWTPARQGVFNPLNPLWRHTQDLNHCSQGDSLGFAVWHSRGSERQEFMGRATLLPSQFIPGGFDGELALSGGPGKCAGDNTLRVRVDVLGADFLDLVDMMKPTLMTAGVLNRSQVLLALSERAAMTALHLNGGNHAGAERLVLQMPQTLASPISPSAPRSSSASRVFASPPKSPVKTPTKAPSKAGAKATGKSPPTPHLTVPKQEEVSEPASPVTAKDEAKSGTPAGGIKIKAALAKISAAAKITKKDKNKSEEVAALDVAAQEVPAQEVASRQDWLWAHFATLLQLGSEAKSMCVMELELLNEARDIPKDSPALDTVSSDLNHLQETLEALSAAAAHPCDGKPCDGINYDQVHDESTGQLTSELSESKAELESLSAELGDMKVKALLGERVHADDQEQLEQMSRQHNIMVREWQERGILLKQMEQNQQTHEPFDHVLKQMLPAFSLEMAQSETELESELKRHQNQQRFRNQEHHSVFACNMQEVVGCKSRLQAVSHVLLRWERLLMVAAYARSMDAFRSAAIFGSATCRHMHERTSAARLEALAQEVFARWTRIAFSLMLQNFSVMLQHHHRHHQHRRKKGLHDGPTLRKGDTESMRRVEAPQVSSASPSAAPVFQCQEPCPDPTVLWHWARLAILVDQTRVRSNMCAKPLRLRVTIVRARGLWSVDPSRISEPCCTCEVPGKPASRFLANAALGNTQSSSSPVWNYTQDVNQCTIGNSLAFSVWHSMGTERQELVGTARLLHSQFYPDGFDGELGLAGGPTDIAFAGALRVRVEVLDAGGHRVVNHAQEDRPLQPSGLAELVSVMRPFGSLLNTPRMLNAAVRRWAHRLAAIGEQTAIAKMALMGSAAPVKAKSKPAAKAKSKAGAKALQGALLSALAVAKAESKAAAKTESKAAAKVDSKAPAKAESKAAAKADSKAAAKAESKAAVKAEGKASPKLKAAVLLSVKAKSKSASPKPADSSPVPSPRETVFEESEVQLEPPTGSGGSEAECTEVVQEDDDAAVGELAKQEEQVSLPEWNWAKLTTLLQLDAAAQECKSGFRTETQPWSSSGAICSWTRFTFHAVWAAAEEAVLDHLHHRPHRHHRFTFARVGVSSVPNIVAWRWIRPSSIWDMVQQATPASSGSHLSAMSLATRTWAGRLAELAAQHVEFTDSPSDAAQQVAQKWAKVATAAQLAAACRTQNWCEPGLGVEVTLWKWVRLVLRLLSIMGSSIAQRILVLCASRRGRILAYARWARLTVFLLCGHLEKVMAGCLHAAASCVNRRYIRAVATGQYWRFLQPKLGWARLFVLLERTVVHEQTRCCLHDVVERHSARMAQLSASAELHKEHALAIHEMMYNETQQRIEQSSRRRPISGSSKVLGEFKSQIEDASRATLARSHALLFSPQEPEASQGYLDHRVEDACWPALASDQTLLPPDKTSRQKKPLAEPL